MCIATLRIRRLCHLLSDIVFNDSFTCVSTYILYYICTYQIITGTGFTIGITFIAASLSILQKRTWNLFYYARNRQYRLHNLIPNNIEQKGIYKTTGEWYFRSRLLRQAESNYVQSLCALCLVLVFIFEYKFERKIYLIYAISTLKQDSVFFCKCETFRMKKNFRIQKKKSKWEVNFFHGIRRSSHSFTLCQYLCVFA